MKKCAEACISIFRMVMKMIGEVLLNASDEEIKVKGDGEVLFAREFDGEILGVNGTLIRRM